MARPSSPCRRPSASCTPASRRPREQKKWQQVIPLVERMDYLGAQSNSLAFCLSVEKLLGIDREMPERVKRDPRADRRAAAHQQPPGVVRHARHGNRRHHRPALRVPRARDADEPERAARRLPVLPELHPRRRPARGHPARLQGSGQGVPRSLPRQARRIRDADHQEPDLAGSHARRRRDHATRTAASGACSVRSRAPPAATTTCAARSRTCGYDTYEFDVIGASNGDVYDRYLDARRRDARERQDLPPGARAHRRRSARGRSTTSASCRRPRTRSTPRWKR